MKTASQSSPLRLVLRIAAVAVAVSFLVYYVRLAARGGVAQEKVGSSAGAKLAPVVFSSSKSRVLNVPAPGHVPLTLREQAEAKARELAMPSPELKPYLAPDMPTASSTVFSGSKSGLVVLPTPGAPTFAIPQAKPPPRITTQTQLATPPPRDLRAP